MKSPYFMQGSAIPKMKKLVFSSQIASLGGFFLTESET